MQTKGDFTKINKVLYCVPFLIFVLFCFSAKKLKTPVYVRQSAFDGIQMETVETSSGSTLKISAELADYWFKDGYLPEEMIREFVAYNENALAGMLQDFGLNELGFKLEYNISPDYSKTKLSRNLSSGICRVYIANALERETDYIKVAAELIANFTRNANSDNYREL